VTERQHLGRAEKEALKDNMKLSERGGELVAVAAIVLVALFLRAPGMVHRVFHFLVWFG
jgi:hypothetical protein